MKEEPFLHRQTVQLFIKDVDHLFSTIGYKMANKPLCVA